MIVRFVTPWGDEREADLDEIIAQVRAGVSLPDALMGVLAHPGEQRPARWTWATPDGPVIARGGAIPRGMTSWAGRLVDRFGLLVELCAFHECSVEEAERLIERAEEVERTRSQMFEGWLASYEGFQAYLHLEETEGPHYAGEFIPAPDSWRKWGWGNVPGASLRGRLLYRPYVSKLEREYWANHPRPDWPLCPHCGAAVVTYGVLTEKQ